MRLPTLVFVLSVLITSTGQAQETFLGQNYQIQVAPGSQSFPNSLAFSRPQQGFGLNQPFAQPNMALDQTFASSQFGSQSERPPLEFSDRSGRKIGSTYSPTIERAPPMFGDSFAQGTQVLAFDGRIAFGDLALAGGSRRAKIAENSKALTEDRVFVMYNHFRNAVEADASDFIVGPDRQSFSVNRFTLGFEKTLLDGLFSVDVRLPVSEGYAFNTPNFGVAGGEAGNLAVSIKALLFSTSFTSVIAGVTADLPTGSNAFGFANLENFEIGNESTHLSPFVGVLRTPNSRIYQQLFLQVDTPVSSNSLSVNGLDSDFDEQTLLYIDGAIGTFLFRKTERERRRSRRLALNSLAVSFEGHYTTTLNDTEVVSLLTSSSVLEFGNFANRRDIVNLTLGLHGVLNNGTQIRIGGVFPVTVGDDRLFDSEVQVQLNLPF